jgi:hypothetical protein
VLRRGALVLALRPVQINPYWQHGGDAITESIDIHGKQVWVNGQRYTRFSTEPDVVAIAEFLDGDVVWLIENKPQQTAQSLRSDSGLLSAACEFHFSLAPGDTTSFYLSAPLRDGSSQALALLYAGLIQEAKRYVVWYSKRIYENGMVPPILNTDGTINRGYGSDIEFDVQGEFVAIAADIYRLSRDRDFLKAIFEPVVRATRFIDELCARTIGAEFATAIRPMLLRKNGDTLELFRAVPDTWWDGEGITLRELPTSFGTVNLRARRDASRVTVELTLTGPAPDKIVLRYPGARQAHADGKPCQIDGDLIKVAHPKRLVIDF